MSLNTIMGSKEGKYLIVQPHFLLADNIISHAIGPRVFLELMKLYEINPVSDSNIITRYFYCDQIMELDQARNKKFFVSHIQNREVYCGVEILTVNRFDLSITSFPINDHYHHERQSVVFSKSLDTGIDIKLEILVSKILDPAIRSQQIPALLKGLEREQPVVEALVNNSANDESDDSDDDDSSSSADDDDSASVISLSFQLIVSKNHVSAVKEVETLARYCQGDKILS